MIWALMSDGTDASQPPASVDVRHFLAAVAQDVESLNRRSELLEALIDSVRASEPNDQEHAQ